MNCATCGLPIDDEHPGFGEQAGKHAANTCLRLLRDALAEAHKPSVAAIYGYEAGLNEASCRIAELEAEVATLREVTTPRQFSEQTPEVGQEFMYWSPGLGWVQDVWASCQSAREMNEDFEVFLWLPYPPAPEE